VQIKVKVYITLSFGGVNILRASVICILCLAKQFVMKVILCALCFFKEIEMSHIFSAYSCSCSCLWSITSIWLWWCFNL